MLRAGDEGFDERKYGFAGLVEALRFGQREGLFRLDRDRQGVLRVYPGQLLQRAEGVMTGADAGPAHRDPIMAAATAPAAPVDEPLDVAEPIEYTPAAASSVAGAAPAPAAKAAKRRVGTAEFVMRYKDEERRHVVPVTMSAPVTVKYELATVVERDPSR